MTRFRPNPAPPSACGPGVQPGHRPDITMAVTAGAARVMADYGYPPVGEVVLANGRRADLMGVGADGTIMIVEVKSGVDDARADRKWQDYLAFADLFYFAVPPEFPPESLAQTVSLPERAGIIVADGFDGAVVQPATAVRLAGARRKALLIRLARLAAARPDR